MKIHKLTSKGQALEMLVIFGVLVIGGIILMSIGLLGEYLGRMYSTVNQKPPYLIKEIIQS